MLLLSLTKSYHAKNIIFQIFKIVKSRMMVRVLMVMVMMWMMMLIAGVSPKREMVRRLWLIDPADHGADRTLCIKHYKLCFVQCTLQYTKIEYFHWNGNTTYTTKGHKIESKIKCTNWTSMAHHNHETKPKGVSSCCGSIGISYFLSEYFAVLFKREWGSEAGGRVMTWIGGWRGRPGMWR